MDGIVIPPRIVGGHDAECRFHVAANRAIPIECDHGHDVCPICDPCTCNKRAKLVAQVASDSNTNQE